MARCRVASAVYENPRIDNDYSEVVVQQNREWRSMASNRPKKLPRTIETDVKGGRAKSKSGRKQRGYS